MSFKDGTIARHVHKAALTVSSCPAVMFAVNWLIVAAYLVSALDKDSVIVSSSTAHYVLITQLLIECVQVNGTGLSLVYSIKSFAQLVHQYHVFAKCYQC